MGISFRHYLFAEDGSLRRMPKRIVDELPSGRDASPEYAGSRQQVAYVVVGTLTAGRLGSSTPAASIGASMTRAAPARTCANG